MIIVVLPSVTVNVRRSAFWQNVNVTCSLGCVRPALASKRAVPAASLASVVRLRPQRPDTARNQAKGDGGTPHGDHGLEETLHEGQPGGFRGDSTTMPSSRIQGPWKPLPSAIASPTS